MADIRLADKMQGGFFTTNTTRLRIPRLQFSAIKNDILGENYSLSIAFVDEKKSRELNKKYRKKDKVANVLSFSLKKKEGEIILCGTVIKKEAESFGKTFGLHLGILVIHGMLHLKGMRHGSIMDKAEKKYDQKYFYRNRRRFLHDPDSSGGISQRRTKS